MPLPPLDFPASPAIGDTYPNPPVTGQPTYQWDGVTWLSKFALGKEYVPLDGSAAMTGLLTLSGDPTAPMHAATKSYVDSTEKGRKNYIINGAMMVSQENGTTQLNVTGAYPVDMFFISVACSAAWNVGQIDSATPGGSPNRIRVICGTPDAAVAAGDIAALVCKTEGLRAADLRFGTASAKQVTVQFGVRAPAGTYGVSLMNGAANRSYIAEYVITAGEANTDVVKSVTIQGDVTGTWLKDNGNGLQIAWCLMAGSTFQQAAGSWGTGNCYGTSNQFNFMGSSAYFELFDVSLTEGTVAPPFQVPDYAGELELCQRYWFKIGGAAQSIFLDGNNVAGGIMAHIRHSMRAAPSWLVSGAFTTTNTNTVSFFAGPDLTSIYVATAAAGRAYWYNNAGSYLTANARL
jgi:hypothetical protein